jgi:hypothetical protein
MPGKGSSSREAVEPDHHHLGADDGLMERQVLQALTLAPEADLAAASWDLGASIHRQRALHAVAGWNLPAVACAADEAGAVAQLAPRSWYTGRRRRQTPASLL